MSNLLPQPQKAAIVRIYRKRYLAVVFLAIMFIALSGVVLLLPSLFIVKNDEHSLEAERTVLESHDASTIQSSLTASIDDINGRLGVFSTTAIASPLVADTLDPVLAADTSTVHITDISYQPNTNGSTANVEVAGVADSREALLAFADRLKATTGFSDVTLPIMSFIKDSNVTFTIGATVALK